MTWGPICIYCSLFTRINISVTFCVTHVLSFNSLEIHIFIIK